MERRRISHAAARPGDGLVMRTVRLLVQLTRQVAVGVEYRGQPNNLSFAEQNRWVDAFVAFFPTRNLSLTAAAVDLGSIAGQPRQRGIYLSAQIGF